MIRRSPIAGSWYPGEPDRVAAEVEACLSQVRLPSIDGRLRALVSPHAGLHFSGPVAAWGYSLLRGCRDLTVVLVGPWHRPHFEAVSLYARGAWETPLGSVPVDEDLAAALLACKGIEDRSEAHLREHSIEMQLPFLQHLVAGLRIVPILLSTQSRQEVDALAVALSNTLPGREALLVASSDLSHYEPAPVAHQLDSEVIRRVERFDADGLMSLIERAPHHACGGGPIVAVMRAARGLGAERASVLRYGDSGDVAPHDKREVVGYMSAALTSSA